MITIKKIDGKTIIIINGKDMGVNKLSTAWKYAFLARETENNARRSVRIARRLARKAYICYNCHHVFDEPSVFYSNAGEFWGARFSTREYVCPRCHLDDYGEALPCVVCDETMVDDEINGGICEKCIDSKRFDPEYCYRISKGETEKVEINVFLAAMFTEKEIEKILHEKLMERNSREKVDCSAFIDNDLEWFSETMRKEEE